MSRAIWRWVLVALSVLAAVAGATAPAVAQPAVSPALTTSPISDAAAYSGTCPNGAPARDVRFCRFILRYNTKPGTLSTVVGDFLGVTQASQTHSIGLIIAVEKYPGMPGHNLSAAKIDGDLLQDFLIKDQQDIPSVPQRWYRD